MMFLVILILCVINIASSNKKYSMMFLVIIILGPMEEFAKVQS
jgi:hypothetical protein